MELYRPEFLISWHAAVLKLVLKVKLSICTEAKSQRGREHCQLDWSSIVSHFSNTAKHFVFVVSPSWSHLSCQNGKLFFLSAMNHPCRSVSQFQIINWSLGEKMSPWQPCTIIMSTRLRPSSALFTVKFPSSCQTRFAPCYFTTEHAVRVQVWAVSSVSISHTSAPQPARLLCHVVISEWRRCNDQEVVNTQIWLCFMVVTFLSDLYRRALQVVCDKFQGQGWKCDCQVVKHLTRCCLLRRAYRVVDEGSGRRVRATHSLLIRWLLWHFEFIYCI